MATAGVVGMAEVVSPTSSSKRMLSGSVAMWSFIWVGAAAAFLIFINMALMGRAAR